MKSVLLLTKYTHQPLHSLQEHLWTHNYLNLEADGQQQQVTTQSATPVS